MSTLTVETVQAVETVECLQHLMLETRGLVLGVASKAAKHLEHTLEPHLLSPSFGDTITTRSSAMPGGYVRNTEL